MANGLILYRSKYGATEKYALWLKEAAGFDCIETKKADAKTAQPYDTIVLMGGVYAGGVAGLDFLKKHFEALKGKRIFLFAVGASPYDEKAIAEGMSRCLKGELAGLPCFYGRGMWDLEKMNFADRTLCKLLLKATARQDPATFEPWQTALASVKPGESCDWTDKSYLEPLLAALREG